jgi:DnaD/phage-associated family protein
MNRIWVKLFLEILHDPKMNRLPNHLWRRAIELFLLAGGNGDDGTLPPVEDMAWILRLSKEKMLEDLQDLAGIGVAYEAEPGKWVVVNFKKRQYSESYERMKRYRARNGSRNDDVTDVENCASSSSSLSSSDSDSLIKEKNEKNVFRVYERNIGMITPLIADGLNADIDQYSEDWVVTAIKYATRQEKRSLSYVEGCLRGWKRDGLAKPPAIDAARSHQNRTSAVDEIRAFAKEQGIEV